MLIIIPLLLLPILAAVPLRFNSAIEFYHDLNSSTIQFLLSRMTLNQDSILLLGQLVGDDRVNIKKEYQSSCQLFTEGYAKEILKLTHDHPSLEYLLLGPACLSKNIIKARKNTIPKMWPPTGFPLLIIDLNLSNIDTADITSLLGEALKKPQWWYSASWVSSIKWNEIADLSFWRMIPAGAYYGGNINPYLVRSLSDMPSSPINHLEHLLMNSIRILLGSKRVPANVIQQAKSLGLDKLSKFVHLDDQWSKSVIEFLTILYENDLQSDILPNALSKSQLFKLEHWQEIIQQKCMDQTTAVNDILELLTVTFLFDRQDTDAIKSIFESFLNSLEDWSILRPVVIISAIDAFKDQLGNSFFIPYLDKLPNDPNILLQLPPEWFKGSKGLQAIKHHLKNKFDPLMEKFSLRIFFGLENPYINLLYQEWDNDKENWPGLVAAHSRIRQRVQLPFTPSTIDRGTYDPNLDASYDDAILTNSNIIGLESQCVERSEILSACNNNLMRQWDKGQRITLCRAVCPEERGWTA